MEQGQILFPDTPSPAEHSSRVVQFQPRASQRTTHPGSRFRLNGDGLAQRLRHDVERQLAHRRRMLAHLNEQQQANSRA